VLRTVEGHITFPGYIIGIITVLMLYRQGICAYILGHLRLLLIFERRVGEAIERSY
jgi:hypothetical protein